MTNLLYNEFVIHQGGRHHLYAGIYASGTWTGDRKNDNGPRQQATPRAEAIVIREQEKCWNS